MWMSLGSMSLRLSQYLQSLSNRKVAIELLPTMYIYTWPIIIDLGISAFLANSALTLSR